MKNESKEIKNENLEEIKELGTTVPKEDNHSNIQVVTIIGQIEGHNVQPPQNKTTKYEHMIPEIINLEQNDNVEGILFVLNTVGGDVEAGLAIAEMIRSLGKPTVSLVIGGGHSIGVPLATSSDYSFICPSATMIIHPIRMNGLIIGVPQTFEYFNKMQERINDFVVRTSNVKKEKYTISNVASIAPQMDSRVLNAYTKMGFTVTVDPSVSYAGHFDAKTRMITLQCEDSTIYHELGHFLAFVAGNVDTTSSFEAVYNSEKSKFTGVRKAYATQNASEYFAESVLNYVENPSALKSQRPQTYEAIVNALSKVTDAQITKIMNVYKVVWK